MYTFTSYTLLIAYLSYALYKNTVYNYKLLMYYYIQSIVYKFITNNCKCCFI
jgi:hypothetical protein